MPPGGRRSSSLPDPSSNRAPPSPPMRKPADSSSSTLSSGLTLSWPRADPASSPLATGCRPGAIESSKVPPKAPMRRHSRRRVAGGTAWGSKQDKNTAMGRREALRKPTHCDRRSPRLPAPSRTAAPLGGQGHDSMPERRGWCADHLSWHQFGGSHPSAQRVCHGPAAAPAR